VHFLPFLVAALEGATTLAVEVIALRLAVPIVGSSSTLTGIVLAVVLLALSFGYWRGGISSSSLGAKGPQQLAINIMIAAAFYGFVTFPLFAQTLEGMVGTLGFEIGIALTSLLLLFYPVFLASQTIPMLTQLVSSGRPGQDAGLMLFFSTLGSVLGGTLTPMLLFPTLGVSTTGWVVAALLVVCGLLISSANRTRAMVLMQLALLAVLLLMPALNPTRAQIDTVYQSFRIRTAGEAYGRSSPYPVQTRLMFAGGLAQSGWNPDLEASPFRYVNEIVNRALALEPKRVLVIGAAGFSIPEMLAKRGVEIVAVDIDPAVKTIAETHMLERPLSNRIEFVPISARRAVRQLETRGERFDACVLDAYAGRSIMPEVVTLEFFGSLKPLCARVFMNALLDPGQRSSFASNLFTTMRQVWPGVHWREVTRLRQAKVINVVVTDQPQAEYQSEPRAGRVYTDDRNSADADFVALWR
jgi:predicted membrane-bound spermidine synthase